MSDDLESRAIALWVGAADAAVKGGAEPPEGTWADETEDVKEHYRTLAASMERAQDRPAPL
jgi:hypothetical protein